MSRVIRYEPYFNPHGERSKFYQNLTGVGGLLFKLDQGDPKPLVDYFLRAGGPRLLSEEDCTWLGMCLEGLLSPRRNGRPRGSVTPKTAAIARAAFLVRIGKAEWCRKRG